MALILAIQPDEQQAAILSGVVMNQLRADLVLVDSKEAALARIKKQVPDLILLAAELGRPDDEEFASRLRKISNTEHLRMLSMPPLGSSDEDDEGDSGGLLRAFKRKRPESRRRGRNPQLFAKELRACLKRAERIKADRKLERHLAQTTAADEAMPEVAAPPTEEPQAVPISTPPTEEPAVQAANEPAPSSSHAALAPEPPAITIATLEARVTMSMRALDTPDAGPGDEADMIIRALRVPPRVAAVAYPRGCRIGRIRLVRAPKPRMTTMRRPVMEPPPSGLRTRYEAAAY